MSRVAQIQKTWWALKMTWAKWIFEIDELLRLPDNDVTYETSHYSFLVKLQWRSKESLFSPYRKWVNVVVVLDVKQHHRAPGAPPMMVILILHKLQHKKNQTSNQRGHFKMQVCLWPSHIVSTCCRLLSYFRDSTGCTSLWVEVSTLQQLFETEVNTWKL